jgi:hypothetical protein|mmetsp:Transcript_67166/g.178685  ORF Transcript_67166/g.178685 Transcript_67166/m.178685 type:complete len:196 (-) Transcript_67166:339-926(-)
MPVRFSKCFTPIEQGGYGVTLSKKPQGSLTEDGIRRCAIRLRTELDTSSFARSPRWETFRDDADELHTMLLAKADAMRGKAASEAGRRDANMATSPNLKPQLIQPNLVGTPAKYAALERLLRPMSDYSVLALPEEKILQLHPLSDGAKAGKHPDGARRVHVCRWREEMAFESFARWPSSLLQSRRWRRRGGAIAS